MDGPTAFLRHGPRRAVALATAAGLAVTAMSLLPFTEVAYRSSTLHVAIETAATLIALVVAVLLFGRFVRAPMRPELVLAASLLLLALTNLFFSVIPWVADPENPGSYETWAPIVGRLLGLSGLAVGALLPVVPVRRPQQALLRAFAWVGAALLTTGVVVAVLAPHLPVGVDPGLSPDSSSLELVGDPGVLVSQLVCLILSLVAAYGFARRAERTADELMTWLAAAAVLGAFSRLNYFLFPSIYSEWVYVGDFLRIAFYALILIGALQEIGAYQRELSEMAVHRERRRIARELHDGLAQELAFISSQAQRLAGSGDESTVRIADAAARALDESRQAIATLARPVDASLDASVAQAAEEVAWRDGIDVRLELDVDLRAPDAVHDALMRIVREAVHNAARHGGARSVTVGLTGSDGFRLTVVDDGDGFPAAELNGTGFGMTSMRERAEALGGRVEVTPGAERGVRVEVWLP